MAIESECTMTGNLFDLTGKRALITGSSMGIGFALARGLAQYGASVVLNARDADWLEAAADILRGEGYSIETAAFDVTDSAAVAEGVAGIEANGALDILINNAGIQHVAAIDEFPTEKWDAIIAINLTSAFHTTAAALPMMRKSGWGRIINISSAHGLTASPYKSAYIAAKHGVVGLTKTTALETAQEPITANAICPGYVLTPLVEAQIPDTMKEYDMSREDVIKNVMLTRQPSKEFATVEQLGGTAVFLASDAAAQITGTTISVDGGWTAL